MLSEISKDKGALYETEVNSKRFYYVLFETFHVLCFCVGETKIKRNYLCKFVNDESFLDMRITNMIWSVECDKKKITGYHIGRVLLKKDRL